MKLTLSRNIGVQDARRLGLDPAKAKEGRTVDVTDRKAIDELRSRGLVIETAAEGTSVEVRAAETPDFEAMTKDELKAHADANAIEGVTLAMSKDEMVKAVKKASKAR
ncbi:MAG TPA: hypothetical protein VF170_09875 [Planctomycetaceae bacterium]